MEIVKNILDMFDCRGIVQINNKTYVGDNIQISGDKIIIDGVIQNTNDLLVGPINIVVNGNVGSIKTGTGDIKANNVGTITSTTGDITCGDISGSVTNFSGDINCINIHGNVTTISGDIIGGKKK